MKSGGFPGQRAAVAARMEQVRREGRRLATRRMFFGAAVGGVLGAAGGGWAAGAFAGSPTARGTAAERDAERAPHPASRAHELATGKLEDLIRFRADFLVAVKQTRRPDSTLWLGVERLAAAAIDGPPATREAIRQLLAVLEADRPSVPAHVRRWLELVCERRR